MAAYYNEFDPHTAAWLRELIKEGVIAHGEVDTRSIVEVTGADLKGFTQCHFFAGIGGWSAALRLAGWGDDRHVWTGSCPCQPFSAAGKGTGVEDERHLWPEFYRLIEECRPRVVFGEQVANAVGKRWLDIVHHDMENIGYAIGPVVLPACSVGAFHIRQRLWFVADSKFGGSQGRGERLGAPESGVPAENGGKGELADSNGGQSGDGELQPGGQHGLFTEGCGTDELADCSGVGLEEQKLQFRQGVEQLQPRTIPGELADPSIKGGERPPAPGREGLPDTSGSGKDSGLADTSDTGPQGRGSTERAGEREIGQADARSAAGIVEDPELSAEERLGTECGEGLREQESGGSTGAGMADASRADGRDARVLQGRPGSGFWDNAVWIPCRDGKARPIESATERLADGLPGDLGLVRLESYPDRPHEERLIYSPLIKKGKGRKMRLAGYGNAIVPQVAAEVIKAYDSLRRE